MSRPRDRHWLGLVATNLFLLPVLTGAAGLTYIMVGGTHRALIERIAVAAMIGVVFLQLHSRLRKATDRGFPSEFERAVRPEPSVARVDPLVLKLRDELMNSIKSRGYFRHFLWPRLVSLAERRGGTAATLSEPGAAWLPYRRPSRRTLAALVKRIEEL